MPPDLVFLHAAVDRHPSRPLCRVSLALRLPSGTLAAHEEAADTETALREAFRELEREVERELARLRREHHWRRARRRAAERVRQRVLAVQPTHDERAESVLAWVTPQLEALEAYARREIEFLQSSGELFRGELEAEDVVDAAILEAVGQEDAKPAGLEPRAWLVKLLVETLEREVARVREERENVVHLEEDVSEVPPEERPSTLRDEMLDFFQPDDDWCVEDVLPSIGVSDPEHEEQAMELARGVNEALTHLPRRWREAFLLLAIEGFAEDEAEQILRRPGDSVRADAERARRFLLDRLAERDLVEAPAGASSEPGTVRSETASERR